METKDRRWYDSHLETSRTLKLLEKLSEEEKTDILNDISEIQSMMTKLDDIVNDYIEATIIIGDN